MARLKVFIASLDGLHDWIVAAPSQAAALEAWGTHQNLFQQGAATTIGDAKAVSAAMSAPGMLFKRLHGRDGPFEAANAVNDRAGWEAAAQAAAAGKPKPRPKPSRVALDKAQAALDAQRREDQQARLPLQAAFEASRQALEDFDQSSFEGLARLESVRQEAEQAYRRGG